MTMTQTTKLIEGLRGIACTLVFFHKETVNMLNFITVFWHYIMIPFINDKIMTFLYFELR